MSHTVFFGVSGTQKTFEFQDIPVPDVGELVVIDGTGYVARSRSWAFLTRSSDAAMVTVVIARQDGEPGEGDRPRSRWA